MFSEQTIIDIANNYGPLVYLVIVAMTFFEGETIVLLTGALISGGEITLSVASLAFFAVLGSFGGDQTWFYIGRRYGSPLLNRWPSMAEKMDWVLQHLHRHENLFILSFRFIYGLRNVSPFLIGMSKVSRCKFLLLNLIAAVIWANVFSWGGYFLGKALEIYLGKSKIYVLLGLVLMILLMTLIKVLRHRHKMLRISRKEEQENG